MYMSRQARTQKMGTDSETKGTESISSSGPVSSRSGTGSRTSSGVKSEFQVEQEYVEIQVDVKSGGAGDVENRELSNLVEEKQKSSFGSSASARIKQKVAKRLVSFSKRSTPSRLDRTKSAAAHALKGLKFISKTESGTGWAAVEKRFDQLTASTSGYLPRSHFGECIGMKKESEMFAEGLFDALVRNKGIQGDSINKAQLKEFWEQISDQSFDSRLQTFFNMVDKNADGRITEEEIREIITLSASANNLLNIQKQADEYAALIMEELDPDNVGYIMIHNLEMLLLEAPSHSFKGGPGDSRNLSQLLSDKLKPTLENNPLRRWYENTKYCLQDNWQRIWVMALWIGAMSGLFAYKYVQYRNRAAYVVMGHCVCMAKGAAETLKLNMALILLPVCRNTITWLRNNTKLGVVVPFDDNLNFHQVIAVGIVIGVGIHSVAHLACDFPRLIHAKSGEKYGAMKKYFGRRCPSYWEFIKGVEGVTGIVMVVMMAIAFTLATPWFRRGQAKLPKILKNLTGFNSFWYSHHLYIIVYILLIVHGIYLYLAEEWYEKTTWMYLAFPLVLYAGERLIRAFRSSVEPVEIQKVIVYTGNVMSLQMSKPESFHYKSGQYMFVNCAAVSPFEWHPFSITSAPEDDHLSVHIRIVGDWTGQLRTVFSKVCRPSLSGNSGLLRADCVQEDIKPLKTFPKVLIDGPYGAPAQEYKKYEVVLLVGLGIGTTPMISIVKDIVNNMRARKKDEENNGLSENEEGANGDDNNDGDEFKTRRAYFYWVTKEQGSFDWFKDVMNEATDLDHEGVIELHNYCSSVYEEGDARCALIAMLQSLHHAKNGVDIVSGTRVKSHFAKPNWRSVFKHVALNHPRARVGVFYCGLPAVAKELRHLALDFSHKTNTTFDFHKENF